MDSKNYTQVLIDGKVYTLGGTEDEAYLQKAASYVNEKNHTLRKLPGFTKQSMEYQNVMVQLNMADDYFKAMENCQEAENQRDAMEKETYSLKHELVSTQMKLEAVLKDLEERQVELEEIRKEKKRLEKDFKEALNKNLQQEKEKEEKEEQPAPQKPEPQKPEPQPQEEEKPTEPEQPHLSQQELARKALEAARLASHKK